MRRYLSAAPAAALALALLAGAPVFAAQHTADVMMTRLTELGISVEGVELTEEQMGQVQLILSDANLTDENKVAAINELLGL